MQVHPSDDAVRWLHLSDLHLGCRGGEIWWQAHDELRAAIQDGVRRLGAPDLVLFTGDLTFSGSADELGMVDRFLDDLHGWIREADDGADPVLVAIPGNHDVLRPRGADAWRYLVLEKYPLGTDDENVRDLRKLLWESRDASLVEPLFEPYQAWLRRRVLPQRGRPGVNVRLSHFPGDIRVDLDLPGRFPLLVVGLNSTWMQYKGGDFDGHLEMPVAQFHAALADTPESASPLACLQGKQALLLMHHPESWLSTKARSEFRQSVYTPRRFAVCLHGHLHEGRARLVAEAGGAPRAYFQVPSLFGMEHYGSRHEERLVGFAWGTITARGEVRVWPVRRIVRGDDEAVFDRDPSFHCLDDGSVVLRAADTAEPDRGAVRMPPATEGNLETTRRLKVFLCHANEDKAAVREVYGKLCDDGFDPWLDEENLLPGQTWRQVVPRIIRETDVVVVFMSSFSVEKVGYLQKEVKLAREVSEEHPAGAIFLIPARLDACQAPQALSDWQHVDLFLPDGYDKLRRVLEVKAGLGGPVAERPGPEAPKSPDHETPDLSRALEQACEQRAEFIAARRSTRAIDETIVGLKRALREDGHLKEGDILGERFKLHQLIGQGGFAQVWKAYDRERRTFVAVKVLHTQYGRDKSRRDRFFRGARHMAQLHEHPGIVDVYEEKCNDGGYHFFVMEYVGGGDLRQAVTSGRLSPADRMKVVLGVGEALQFAHERGVIHRDVKPANVLLTVDGRTKLTDFDLVRAADTTGGTRTSMLGTFLYAAPEAMMDGKQAAKPADVYSLGMTALFVLHGRDLPPVVLRNLSSFLASLDVAEPVCKIVERALEWEVENRWASVAEFCQALSQTDDLHTEPQALPDVSATATSSKKKSRPGTGLERLDEAQVLGSVVAVSRDAGKAFIEPVMGTRFLWVPGGSFRMGSDKSSVEQPIHPVRVSPFWLAETAVTNRLYAVFLEQIGHEEPGAWRDRRFSAPEQPVVAVSWHDVQAFCKWLSEVSGSTVMLPTEAQWEFAARGEESLEYPWGPEEPDASRACFDQGVQKGKPAPVGAFPEGRGPFGHQDLAGSVWEWCQDVWDAGAYKKRAEAEAVDPIVTSGEDESLKVLRGGCWVNPAEDLRASYRRWYPAPDRLESVGFRLAAAPPPP